MSQLTTPLQLSKPQTPLEPIDLNTVYAETPVARQEIYSNVLSPDCQLAAISYKNADLAIVSTYQQKTLFKFKVYDQKERMARAVKQLAWNPSGVFEHQQWRLLGTQTQGGLLAWNPCLGTTNEFIPLDSKNSYTTVSYCSSGSRFVTGGSLSQLEVYDDSTLQQVHLINSVGLFAKKKIEQVKFFPNSDELYFSASWDASVKFWDCRSKAPTQRIYGIQVQGDAIDMHQNQNTVVIGGAEKEDGIQLWDVRNTEAPMFTLQWEEIIDQNPPINCCKFIPRTSLVMVSTKKDIQQNCRIFDFVKGVWQQDIQLQSPCFGFDMSQSFNNIFVGERNGLVQMFEYDHSKHAGEGWLAGPSDELEVRQEIARELINLHVQSIELNQPFVWPSQQQQEQEQEEEQEIVDSVIEEQQIMEEQLKVQLEQSEVIQVDREEQTISISSPGKKSVKLAQSQRQNSKAQSKDYSASQEQVISLGSPTSLKKKTQGGLSMKTGQYNLEQDSVPQELSSLRTTNKRRLQQQVNQMQEEIMQEFMRKAEMVQILANAEINAFTDSNLTKNAESLKVDEQAQPISTDQFIGNMEQYLQNRELETDGEVFDGSIIDIEKITKELYEQKSNAAKIHQRLPEIKGQVKNMRLLLQEDLIDDGVIKLNVPHSSRHRNDSISLAPSMSRRSVAPSAATINSRALENIRKKDSKAADHFVAQYQKNMIVELPEIGDQVAENFNNFWKSPPTARKYSVQPVDKKSLGKQSSLTQRRGSQLSAYTQSSAVPEKIKQRLPDSDHLAKMRSYLVSVHQNENFVKELGEDGGLIPTAIKMKLDKKNEVREKLGESFIDLLKNNNRAMQKESKIKELIESGIPDETDPDEYLNDEDFSKYQHASLKKDRMVDLGAASMLFNKDKDHKPHPSLQTFEDYVSNGDFMSALELASKDTELIKESQSLQRHKSSFNQELLRQNQFFKSFTQEYQAQLESIMEKGFGNSLNARLKIKDGQFKQKIMSHVTEASNFRKKLPDVFREKKAEGSEELAQKLRSNFKQVALPQDLRLLREAESNIALSSPRNRSVSTISALKAQADPLLDPTYLRRLKMANYGRWFMKPKDFTEKVNFINQELKLNK